jgi:hypothetical protein
MPPPPGAVLPLTRLLLSVSVPAWFRMPPPPPPKARLSVTWQLLSVIVPIGPGLPVERDGLVQEDVNELPNGSGSLIADSP